MLQDAEGIVIKKIRKKKKIPDTFVQSVGLLIGGIIINVNNFSRIIFFSRIMFVYL